MVWALDRFDRIFREGEVCALEPVYQEILEKHCFRDRKGRWIFCWDNTRYINHSFHPTCITTPYSFEIAVVDIAAGQEITNDYGFFNIIEPFDCLPEAGSPRTRVLPDDLLRCAPEWDRQLAAALARFEQVAQPLAGIIKPEHLATVCRVARHGLSYVGNVVGFTPDPGQRSELRLDRLATGEYHTYCELVLQDAVMP